ncbi:MAG TPA: sterol-binding protein [Gammaproteobacteria bacterium]|nr:sterol-binding protein [Gammaproteobacteria bacterium]
MTKKALWVSLAIAAPLTSHAAFMDADWAKKACDAWNADATLTSKLGGDAWAAHDGGRGYKLIQIYREGCGEGSRIQLVIANQDGKARCVSGGAPDGKAFDKKYDYLMHATDDHWTCMGAGKFGCGAMGAMTTGKLKFTGPKMEAMGVMGPFNRFLKLTGQIGGEKGACQ